MKINVVYQYLNYLGRKDPLGNSLSIPEFNTNCAFIVYQFFKKIMGLPEQYQKGARDPVFGFGLNAISEEKIRPLKVLPTALALDGDGYANYPNNYFRKSSCYSVYTIPVPGSGTRNIDVPFVNDAKFNERRTTVLDIPSKTDPVANLHTNKIRFLPFNLSNAYLEYIKFPTTPIMGYVTDYNTAEDIYVGKGAYIEILTPGVAGNIVTCTADLISLGDYTVSSGDTAEDVMIGLTAGINLDILTHNVKAVYDGVKIVLIDLGEIHTTLSASVTGSLSLIKSNFTIWSAQFDWENDVEAMNDIAELLLDKMGISNRDMNLVQWAAKEESK